MLPVRCHDHLVPQLPKAQSEGYVRLYVAPSPYRVNEQTHSAVYNMDRSPLQDSFGLAETDGGHEEERSRLPAAPMAVKGQRTNRITEAQRPIRACRFDTGSRGPSPRTGT